MRAELKVALLRPTAFGSSSGPTSSLTKACRVGMSMQLARPRPNARAYTCHSSTEPVTVSSPSTSASTPIDTWVPTSRRRLS